MKYHAKLEYEGSKHYWWNMAKDALTTELLVPFVNGQVIPIKRRGAKALLNLKSVTALTVYKTKEKLEKLPAGGVPPALKTEAFEKNDCTMELLSEVRTAQAVGAARSVLQKGLAVPKAQVFVIMKFGDPTLDSAYEGVIKPIVKEHGFKALRIDEVQDAGRITDQVLEEISVSRFVLADLTGERPNCYYECGFAHALGKELILTIASEEPVHFDLAGYRFIVWDTEADLRKKLRARLAALTSKGQG